MSKNKVFDFFYMEDVLSCFDRESLVFKIMFSIIIHKIRTLCLHDILNIL